MRPLFSIFFGFFSCFSSFLLLFFFINVSTFFLFLFLFLKFVVFPFLFPFLFSFAFFLFVWGSECFLFGLSFVRIFFEHVFRTFF